MWRTDRRRGRWTSLATMKGLVVIPGCLALALAPSAVFASISRSNDTLTPSQLVTHAAQAFLTVPEFVLSGTVTQSGGTIALDVESMQRGGLVRATLTSSAMVNGFIGTVGLIDIGTQSYLKGSKSFWLSAIGGTTAAQKASAVKVTNELESKWVLLTGAEGKPIVTAFASFTEPGKLAQSLIHGNGVLTKGAVVKYHGVEAIPLKSSESSTIYVADLGAPLPIGLSGSGASITFSYPNNLRVIAPANPISF
jgi:hypothetical protein